MPRTINIHPATAADDETMSETLALAFEHDPILSWVVPDPERRRQRLPAFFAAFVEAYRPLGETHVVDGGRGAALWAPPGVEAVPEDGAEAFGARLETILEEDAERGFAVQELLEEHHPETPCSYLQWLAVAPEHQGTGIGSELLRLVLDRCDSTNTASYLEATSAANRRLYERHGYETIDELTVGGSPPLWPMWREPA